jgi:hypothetical protein
MFLVLRVTAVLKLQQVRRVLLLIEQVALSRLLDPTPHFIEGELSCPNRYINEIKNKENEKRWKKEM